jgi:hypothetical protein
MAEYTLSQTEHAAYDEYKALKGRMDRTRENAGREETRYADVMNQYSVAFWIAMNLVLGIILLLFLIWRARK